MKATPAIAMEATNSLSFQTLTAAGSEESAQCVCGNVVFSHILPITLWTVIVIKKKFQKSLFLSIFSTCFSPNLKV